MPKIDPAAVPVRMGSGYPAPFDAPCAARTRRRLGDAGGLCAFGINLMTLPPGGWSSQRHWHSDEDEFVYVLEGELTLVEDDGETLLRAGECAAFPKDTGNGHHLKNQSSVMAVYLEVGLAQSERPHHLFGRRHDEFECRWQVRPQRWHSVSVDRRRQGSPDAAIVTMLPGIASQRRSPIPATSLSSTPNRIVPSPNILTALEHGAHVVVGTSGLTESDFAEIDGHARRQNRGVLASGNFALTVVLLQKFAATAARLIPQGEIIDYAHDDKVDAPSGTARELALRLSKVRNPNPTVPLAKTVGLRETWGATGA